jgi:hypothetical protein
VAQAKSQADQLLADAKAEAERHRTTAQRHVDELNKQKESVAAHLSQISQLLGTQMPGLADALKPAPAAPAVQSSPARAVTAAPQANGGSQQAPAAAPAAPAPAPAPAPAAPPRQDTAPPSGQAPAGAQSSSARSGGSAGGTPASKQPAGAKQAKSAEGDDWWTE